jgi:pantetheine-phosphate adenylyltransferase
MTIAIYPGTFDPITKGHFDIIERSSRMIDKVIIAVAQDNKKDTLFNQNERFKLVKNETKQFKNVKIELFEGFIVNFLKEIKANFIIRGIRNITDFDYETTMATINKKLYNGAETLFLPANENIKFISSSAIKTIIKLGGNIDEFVSKNVKKAILKKYNL